MRRGTVISAAAAVLLLSAACGTGDGARVGIDLSALWQQAAQTDQIDFIWVRVFDDLDFLEWEDSLASTADYVDLIVSAGLSRRFEVEAVYYDPALVETPTYWGESVIDLQPDDYIDLVVPVFPAGRLTGTVTVGDATLIPHGTAVIATARAPRLDAPTDRELFIEDGMFTGTLPDGIYDLSLDYSLDSAPYGRTDGGSAETLVQGEIVTAASITVGVL